MICVCASSFLSVSRQGDVLYSDGYGRTNSRRQPTPGRLHHRGRVSVISPPSFTNTPPPVASPSAAPISHIPSILNTHTHAW